MNPATIFFILLVGWLSLARASLLPAPQALTAQALSTRVIDVSWTNEDPVDNRIDYWHVQETATDREVYVLRVGTICVSFARLPATDQALVDTDNGPFYDQVSCGEAKVEDVPRDGTFEIAVRSCSDALNCSEPATVSGLTIPVVVPSEPTSVVVVRGNASIGAWWLEPEDPGGDSVRGWVGGYE
jgi:hypothetical protein